MACGHGKLWWKGAGRLGMREGCREARDRARAAARARASQPPEAEVVSRRQSEHPSRIWNPATANAKSRDEYRSGQHLKQIDGLAHSALSLESGQLSWLTQSFQG